MTIYSLVGKRIEDVPPGGIATGVTRFDELLRRVFPEMRSVTSCPKELKKRDIVIADNHLSIQIPEGNRTIVVHHGCAKTHYERDPEWRTISNGFLVNDQRRMFCDENRTFVAPSAWVADQFLVVPQVGIRYNPKIIPHWVDPIPELPESGKPIIIGDWRNHNKGSDSWKQLAALCPQWDFRPLDFHDDAGRSRAFGEASLYLCLSLSEGAGYSVCDAEAANLPIVTTDVGNYREFTDCEVIRWQDRDNLQIVSDAIERKLNAGRVKPSFYRDYTFESWKSAWESVIQ